MNPIFISGVPRSGNTWMQVALSRHPRIHITGHPPSILPRDIQQFHERLVNAGRLAGKWNKEREEDHFAGTGKAECREAMAAYLKRVWRGYADQKKPRWGMKLLWPGKYRDFFSEIWPGAKWVICCRHPWSTIESARNVLNQNGPASASAHRWVAAVRFGIKSALLWPMDKLQAGGRGERTLAMRNLLEYVGEPVADCVLQYAADCEIVHHNTKRERGTWRLSDDDKARLLTRVQGLAETMRRLEYEP